MQGLPQIILSTPIISGMGKATSFKVGSTFTGSIRTSPLKILGKSSVGVLGNSRKFSGHKCIGRLARSSLRQFSFLVFKAQACTTNCAMLLYNSASFLREYFFLLKTCKQNQICLNAGIITTSTMFTHPLAPPCQIFLALLPCLFTGCFFPSLIDVGLRHSCLWPLQLTVLRSPIHDTDITQCEPR